jgi:hypothetical protein
MQEAVDMTQSQVLDMTLHLLGAHDTMDQLELLDHPSN